MFMSWPCQSVAEGPWAFFVDISRTGSTNTFYKGPNNSLDIVEKNTSVATTAQCHSCCRKAAIDSKQMGVAVFQYNLIHSHKLWTRFGPCAVVCWSSIQAMLSSSQHCHEGCMAYVRWGKQGLTWQQLWILSPCAATCDPIYYVLSVGTCLSSRAFECSGKSFSLHPSCYVWKYFQSSEHSTNANCLFGPFFFFFPSWWQGKERGKHSQRKWPIGPKQPLFEIFLFEFWEKAELIWQCTPPPLLDVFSDFVIKRINVYVRF